MAMVAMSGYYPAAPSPPMSTNGSLLRAASTSGTPTSSTYRAAAARRRTSDASALDPNGLQRGGPMVNTVTYGNATIKAQIDSE